MVDLLLDRGRGSAHVDDFLDILEEQLLGVLGGLKGDS